MVKGNSSANRAWAPVLLIVVLWCLVLSSGLAVAYSTHLSRQLFAQLDLLKRDTNDLHVEWGQFLLEQGTLNGFDRIEMLAVDQLNMQVPDSQQIVIIKNQ